MSMRNSIVPTTLAAVALLLMSSAGAYAQVQSGNQQACLNALNKDGAAVAKTQGKENVACLKGAGKGTLPGTAQACLTADLKGKVAKSKSKTTADQTKSCGAAPDFGYTSAPNVNGAAQQASLDIVADVYGASLDAAVQNCTSAKPGCLCQQKVSKTIESLIAVKLSTFIACKKAALKAGASAAAALADCVSNGATPGSIAADTKGKIGKVQAGLTAGIVKTCDGPGVSATVFPGSCTGLTGATLSNCLDTRVECRVCQAIDDMDGLSVDCDLFDDGLANSSCVVAAPVPGFKGALTPTAGRFNYNLTVGLPGANAACNTNFPGSHACTYAELQVAETNGDLVGLQDTANNPVTAFWAIDGSQPPLQQCQDDVTSFLNWEYGTAHTASRGQKVSLTAGVLGPLQSGLQCNFSTAAVGCCL